MKFRTEKTTYPIDANSSMSDSVKYHNGLAEKAVRSYRVRVKVGSSKEEMTEFIRFMEDISKLRGEGKLTVDRDDTDTYPAFIVHYPKEDIDGSWFVIKCYSVLLDI